MNLPQNLFDGNINAQVILCQPNKTRIGEILPYDLNGNFKFNTYSEISFSIDRYYNDLLEGTTKINPYYDLIDSLRVIEIRGVGHFVIQDVDEEVGENEIKSVTCFSLEYSTGQKYLENFYVNTGEEGSVETMYHAKQYGAEYSIDNYYATVNIGNDKFDPYERYYIKKYSNDNGVSYNYEEEQVLDAASFNYYDGSDSEKTLYVKKYPNVRFYWPTKPELSLLHLVFDRIPEWKIGHVDRELWYQERTFSEDRTAVYDFLYNQAAETLNFVMVWDSIRGEVDFYKTTEDGVTANEEIETQWNTDVFISRENLASNIDISYSTDDIKTKLKITGADSLDVRDVNLGQNYIMNLSFYNTPLWMGADLSDKYTQYTHLLEEKTAEYKQLVSDWSATYNEYSDLVNNVPVELSVLLIGDPFDKLHCTYGIIKATEYVENATYYTSTGATVNKDVVKSNVDTDGKSFKKGVIYYINKADNLLPVLKEKLGLYRVGVNDNGTISQIDKTDDVLLTLENAENDSVTIRVRCIKAPTIVPDGEDTTYYKNSDYKVYVTKTTASSGLSITSEHTLTQWINGELTAEELKLSHVPPETGVEVLDFKVKSIGVLGAYLCIAKDETKKENVEDYGIRLLQEKQDVYTKIFITQTEGYMSKEGARCVASAAEPTGGSVGDKWLDTSSKNARIWICTKVDGNGNMTWEEYSVNEDNQGNFVDNSADFENYTRFIDNYEKLQVVQEVLKDKQYHADMLLNGVPYNEFYLVGENINTINLSRVAQMHLVVANKRYVISIAQPSSSYEEEGVIWFQPVVNSDGYTVRHYLNGQWVVYDISEIIKINVNNENIGLGYITFTSAADTETKYVAWVVNGTPHVAYARSQGLSLYKMDLIKIETDMNNYFSEQELVRLSPFIREDEYSDDNFLLTSYESEEEQMSIKQSLLDEGIEQLNKICQPKLSFSMTMANILSIPEFAPLKKQFKLGNFVRVGIRDGYVKRARLLEAQINFEDASDFSVTFGDLISTKSEIDKHADLLSQAVTVSKSVASNKSHWQKGADKATALDNAINDGLRDAALSVGAADGQAITWDRYGIRGRKLIDGTTDQYHDEQFALINNKLAFTTDNWKTSRAVVGEFEVEIDEQKQKMYGLLADALIGGYIQGTEIRGGNLRIGDGTNNYFQVDEKGDVKIVQAGKEKYASTDALEQIDQAYKYRVVLSYNGPMVFANTDDSVKTTITATVYERDNDITSTLNASKFSWIRSSSNPTSDADWNSQHKGVKQITVNHRDVIENSHFSCQVDMD